MSLKNKIVLHTYGCKVNSYETEVMRQQLKNINPKKIKDTNIHVINTCTVTKKIDKEISRKIRQLKKKGGKVILTGCLVERKDREAMDILSLADKVIANDKKFRLGDLLNCKNGNNPVLCGFSGKDRAFIKIEDGCNNYCSYCEVPFVRGNMIRSRDINDIEREFKNLTNAGFNEIVLTGVNLGFYGKERNKSDALCLLLNKLLEIKSKARIRLSSIGPKELTGEIIALIVASKGKICPHVHLSLQSGDEKILKMMNRNYSLNEYKQKMEEIISKIPFCAITTDIIAGFPCETEKEFQNTFNFIKESPFSRLHVFPFSKRPDTAASKMKAQVKEEIKKQRVKMLINLGKTKEREFAEKNIGFIRRVLVESDKKNGLWTGYTDNYIKVKFNSAEELAGKLADIKLLEYKDGSVRGEIIGVGG